MSPFVFMLVLVAAFLHASWNFLAKKAGNSKGFVWLFNVLSSIIYAPILFYMLFSGHVTLTWIQAGFALGSACLHLAYFLFLQRGYETGDLSLSYPLARGTGPLLSTFFAIVIFGERPAIGAIVGIVLLIVGIVFLVGNPLSIFIEGKRGAILYALLTGIFIAGYTLWDKEAVSTLQTSPLLMLESASIVMATLLLPTSLRHWDQVKATWRAHRLEALGVAILSPMAYLLILFVLISNPVSQVAPLRESSVLIGTLMGTRLLAEKQGVRRVFSAALILLGIILLAIG
ncbi:DMT family transporter [Tengunoibacter tsumagoiensis]|uniref:EamA domain-containing protein n=1 Tax=Tengunoibacter tsumagoiensis TaxID=2014871 RepID=A0A401ZW48_9CHLR|nr:DMT family transporter [Tengunoibacter tsumagoiensis]GCE11077.1 hypothetical protein KTT_09360 [Tengunoibacter tsumagoiensis]